MAVREQVTYVLKVEGAPQAAANVKTVSRSVDELRHSQQQAAVVAGGAAGLDPRDAALLARMKALEGDAARLGARASRLPGGSASTAAAAASLSARQRAVIGAAGGSRALGLATPFGGMGALLGIGAGYTLLNQFGASMRHQGEVQQLNAQTTAGIKSTGAAAGVTVKHVQDLAQSWMQLAGVQDETVQAAENVLLTFPRIRNEAGKGNQIFDLTTEAVANVAARMGTDMPQASLQLGKAINDPINGFTALRRIGIQFTDAQVDQIKVMTAAGNRMGAQKIILGELNTEFGGSARAAGKTMPAALVRLQESWEDSRDKLTTGLLPAATTFTNWLAVELPGAIDVAITAMKIFDTGHDNTIERWLRRQPGGSFLGDAFHHSNTRGIGDMLNEGAGGIQNRLFGANLVSGSQFDAARRIKSATERGKWGRTSAADLTMLFGSKERAQEALARSDEDRGMGNPFPQRDVRVNWNQGDPFETRPVILVADGQQIAKVVTKGQQKRTHSEGRGTSHR